MTYPAAMPAKKKSGKNIPNAQRKTEQVLLRLPPEYRERLHELRDEWGLTVSGVVAALLDAHDADDDAR